MKKVILAIFALIVVALIGIMLFMPRIVPVQRKTVIETTPDRIYPHLSNLEQWQEWNPWGAKDPGMKITYGDKKEGQGASYSWMSESQGSGTMTISNAVEPSRVDFDLDFGEQGNAKSYFELKPMGENQTEVIWHMDADMGNNPIGRIFGAMMDGMIGPDFEDGLARLKKLSETDASGTSEPVPKPTPEVTPTP